MDPDELETYSKANPGVLRRCLDAQEIEVYSKLKGCWIPATHPWWSSYSDNYPHLPYRRKSLDITSEPEYTEDMTTNAFTDIALANLRQQILQDGTLLINSFNPESNEQYRLRVMSGVVVACTCPDYVYRNTYCKHQSTLQEFLDQT